MYEFLLLLGLIWLVIASIFDIRKREVPNWLSFSLIIFALGYRLFYSVINSNAMFFVYGLFGFSFFFILAYIFYYARVFAGGDAKLLMGLGVIIPFSYSLFSNLIIACFFIFLLLFVGSFYGLIYSFVLVFRNKKKFAKEFSKQFELRKTCVLIGLVFAILSSIFVIYSQDFVLLLLPLIIILFPLLFIYAKTVEESCMIISVPGKNVAVGDWLYEEVLVGKKKIKPYWEGLSEEDVKLLRKVKKVKIKQGIPFVPGFLVAFLFFLFYLKIIF